MRTWKRTTEKHSNGRDTLTTYISNDGWVIKNYVSYNVGYGSHTIRFAVYKDGEKLSSFDTLKEAKQAIENGWV